MLLGLSKMSSVRQKELRNAFFALLKSGLWEKEVRLVPYGEIDFPAVLDLAEEQSVVGFLAAGIEHVVDGRPAKKDVLQFIGRTVQLEQRNQAMNYFIGVMTEKMNEAGIRSVLVKGQGVARCYERPLWRSCGDVDLLLDAENYDRAKAFLMPIATSVDEENELRKHLGITIDPWLVELHGTLHTRQLIRLNGVLDEVQREVFEGGRVRTWKNDAVDVLLPAADEDVFFVFSHIIQHYFGGGIGLRQVCDWCRLMWTYRDSLNHGLLESRIKKAGVMTEWIAFAALAVDYLGMPVEAMPLYSDDKKWSRKADKVMGFILETGNFGHKRDNSYFQKHSYFVRKCISAWRRVKDLCRHARIFPANSFRFFCGITYNGMVSVMKGE